MHLNIKVDAKFAHFFPYGGAGRLELDYSVFLHRLSRIFKYLGTFIHLPLDKRSIMLRVLGGVSARV